MGVCSLPGQVAASEYFTAVDGGDDLNPGTVEAPFRTINRGVAALVPGDTLYVRSGTYVEAIDVHKSGTAEAPLRIFAYPGETPVVDGQNSIPSQYRALFYLWESYIELSGFEVKNSRYYGIDVAGHHNLVKNCNVHHSYEVNVLMRGNYSVAEGNRVWESNQAVLEIGNAGWGTGIIAARDPDNGISDNVIMRRNVVYNNWGEGISTFEANGTVMEDNISYDNWKVNFYISDATNVLAQRNLVYTSQDSVSRYGRPAHGIAMSNETYRNPLNNITIINNLVFGTSAPFVYFQDDGPNTLSNALIAHNTFVNGTPENAGDGTTVVFVPGAFTNVRFINNIVVQQDGGSVVFVGQGQAGLQFQNNLWSSSPIAAASGPNDVIGDPLFGEQLVDARWFKVNRGSPAVRAAMPLDEVTDDYFGKPRVGVRDIGAHERSRPAVSRQRPN